MRGRAWAPLWPSGHVETARGRFLYSRRLGIVEPVFGNLCAQKGMNRFTLRTRAKVNVQWQLYCLIQNFEKIVRTALPGRLLQERYSARFISHISFANSSTNGT